MASVWVRSCMICRHLNEFAVFDGPQGRRQIYRIPLVNDVERWRETEMPNLCLLLTQTELTFQGTLVALKTGPSNILKLSVCLNKLLEWYFVHFHYYRCDSFSWNVAFAFSCIPDGNSSPQALLAKWHLALFVLLGPDSYQHCPSEIAAGKYIYMVNLTEHLMTFLMTKWRMTRDGTWYNLTAAFNCNQWDFLPCTIAAIAT